MSLVKNKENIIVADGSWDRYLDSYLNRSLAVPWTGTLTGTWTDKQKCAPRIDKQTNSRMPSIDGQVGKRQTRCHLAVQVGKR